MTMDYLAELIQEKGTVAAFPNYFKHVDRLIDLEIARVRAQLFHFNTDEDLPKLPELEHEDIVTLQEKVYVPKKEHPEFNFVGRILGPRGMTAKQLEHETGCKIMVRGRGSLRDAAKEEMNRGKPNWEHLEDDLHILIQCEDNDKRARSKLDKAVDKVKKLLVPSRDGIDELKRKQLMELSIINGTYRANIGPKSSPNIPRLTPLSMLSPIHSPISPPHRVQSAVSSHNLFFGSPLPSPVKDYGSPRSVPSSKSVSNTGGQSFDFAQLNQMMHHFD
uniref:KH domain-containing protein n=1 Tax=Globodera pallida TaxID=36090 RepID=A0A183CAA7_GLOPA